jgi:type I restriction enzyme R subunit
MNPIASKAPVTILFMAACPPDQDALRLDKEAREIEGRLASARFRDLFEVRTRWAVRPADLLDALNDHRPGLVHFSGHGDKSAIILESPDEDSEDVTPRILAKVFATVTDEVRCVVFNACHSIRHAKAVCKHIDVAIGMSRAIDDDAAIVFASSFYRAIASGRSVEAAYEQGIAQMLVEAVGDDDVPRIQTRAGFDAKGLVFADPSLFRLARPTTTVVLDCSPNDLDPQKFGQLIGELRRLSGDLRLEIGTRSAGSVRLAVHTTPEGAESLKRLRAAGQLSELRGYRVLAIEPVEVHTVAAGSGSEWTDVELPFLDQLASMGWKVVTGNLDHPSVTGRESFSEVLIKDDLRKALRRINLRDGAPWLDDARISQAAGAVDRIGHPRLMEANQEGTALLLGGIPVEGLPDWNQGRAQTIQYVDWDHAGNNTFTAVSQFKVATAGQAKESIRPDVTLFVNGIPVVVVECKAREIPEGIPEAVDQLRRYHNARKAAGELEENEGNERLFHTNQFLVATNYDIARVGTIGAEGVHYLEWKDTAPVPLEQVQAALGSDGVSSQERLIAGMLRPSHLLDLIRHFALYTQVSGKTVKVVARYQQFRAVQRAIERLRTGKTRAKDGEHDRRGGIIWHTQGSGKSLTMVFLVRKMRSDPSLKKFKLVVVTDRKQLQQQLSETAMLTGETVRIGRNIASVKKLLAKPGPEIVFAMIQKYVDRDPRAVSPSDDVGELGLLNDDESILVMVDEAHRSHSSALHASLMQALPNCARIGFTGTPIIMGARKRTHEIFGEFIDRYTIKESEADGSTVPILYEGRFAKGAVADGAGLDDELATLFPELSDEEREALKRKYGTTGAILEAPEMIQAKARDMLRHFVANILPNGLKAQVVAYSRRAAVRYQKAFVAARKEVVAEAAALDEATRKLDDLELETRPPKLRGAVRAARVLDRLNDLEFATIISGANNDPPEWAEWTDEGKNEVRITRFKKPFDHDKPDKRDPLGFLIVKSMLLTGFDAPVEGVMYLDRPIREAELLQAMARVNRTARGKAAGLVVDYFGIADHLKEALKAYSAEDIEGALQTLADEIPKLQDRYTRVIALFKERGVDAIHDVESAVQLLEDMRLRAEFAVKLKQFLATLELVLPRPESLAFVRDSQVLGEIHKKARNRYRDGLPELHKSVGRKVQSLIDEHIVSLGIDPRIPPISITDANFGDHVGRQVSPRAKASEMEHAIRHHIRRKLDEDPVHCEALSQRLEQILAKFGQNWDQLVLALQDFVGTVTKGRAKDDATGLDPHLHAPFYDVLKQERSKHPAPNSLTPAQLAALTVMLVEDVIRDEVNLVGFWKSATRQEALRGRIFVFIDDHEIIDFDHADAVADRLMELARANQHKLVRT